MQILYRLSLSPQFAVYFWRHEIVARTVSVLKIMIESGFTLQECKEWQEPQALSDIRDNGDEPSSDCTHFSCQVENSFEKQNTMNSLALCCAALICNCCSFHLEDTKGEDEMQDQDTESWMKFDYQVENACVLLFIPLFCCLLKITVCSSS